MADLYQVFTAACQLGDFDLTDLARLLAEELRKRSEALVRRAEEKSQVHGYKVIGDGWTYIQQAVKCGKPGCKCAAGDLHGPYWYAYRRCEGRVVSKYIGKDFQPVELFEEGEAETNHNR